MFIIFVVSDVQNDLICNKSLIYQIKSQAVRHFMKDQTAFIFGIGTWKHLAGAGGICFRFVVFNVFHSDRFYAPGVVDQKLGIDTEKAE